jgi:hypothetical protein
MAWPHLFIEICVDMNSGSTGGADHSHPSPRGILGSSFIESTSLTVWIEHDRSVPLGLSAPDRRDTPIIVNFPTSQRRAQSPTPAEIHARSFVRSTIFLCSIVVGINSRTQIGCQGEDEGVYFWSILEFEKNDGLQKKILLHPPDILTSQPRF